ncbi:replicative DNA helicase [Bartonella fuyuanensis]|uniref:Replicative DNA helicase n=2 Tax=Bartonella fuyuanensis TaxID=1460968 RepID=A0A840DSM1_9HYPH|nr:replicative DNA helicase [Bartonella fuyuanensis]
MSKASLTINIAFKIANAYNRNRIIQENENSILGFFSLEIFLEQLAMHIISEQTAIFSFYIQNGSISDEQFLKIIHTVKKLQKAPLYINKIGTLSITQLAAYGQRLKRQHNLIVLIIAYTQLIIKNSRHSLENHIQKITLDLKTLPKKLNIPIVALSQLSHQVKNRTDKCSQLSNLGDFSSIKQNAVIRPFIFKYRKANYLKNVEF